MYVGCMSDVCMNGMYEWYLWCVWHGMVWYVCMNVWAV